MKSLTLILFCVTSVYCQAQVLFSYGTQPVTKKEFLNAYHKNGSSSSSAGEYREYLNLYSRYKLKVQAAYDMKLDTISAQKKELAEYKIQLADSYTGADSITNKLIEEAFTRSQKDILVGMIFIPVSSGSVPDSFAAAKKRIQEAYNELGKGTHFEDVALRFSGDPAVSVNKGTIGFITALVLPYAVESAIYSTSTGKYSKPFQLKSGWLIVKNIEERPAAGRVQLSQILIGYPKDKDSSGRTQAKKLADSLHTLLSNGGDFKDLASKFSHDLFSYQEGGLMPAFGTGTYDGSFEREAFALKNPGEISKPFETINGFHILRLEKKISVAPTLDSASYEQLMQQLSAGDRADWVRDQVIEKLKTITYFKQSVIDRSKLQKHTAFVTENPRNINGILKNTQQLFTIGSKPYTIAEYNKYLKGQVAKEDISGDLYERFVEQSLKEQYALKLAKTNTIYQQQIADFKDANLLFAVMQRKVWNAAIEDTSGIKTFYNKNKSKYKWEPSADALIFTAANADIATSFKEQLEKNAFQWRELLENTPGIQADSGRFELGQIPVADRTAFSEKLITSNQPVENSTMVNFGYIIRLYPAGDLKSFDDARGQVISDYQSYLEEKWINELKKKYPVKINEEVVRSLASH